MSKWLLGGLGFVLGGPIGALIGFTIGTVVDSSKRQTTYTFPTMNYPGQRKKQVSIGDIKVAILVLIACVIKADGKVLKAEIDFVKSFLRSNYGKDANEALHLLKHILSQNISVQAVASQIGENVNYSTKLALFHVLVDLANADDDFSQSEKNILQQIAFYMAITNSDMASVFALYNKNENANWAYQVLEIPPNASDDDVKKAYRRMSMKYHPDKITNGGEEMIKRANEKFISIREAYEYIKKQRNIT